MDEELRKLNFHFKHVGIYTSGMDAANSAADEFLDAFGFVPNKGSSSVFASSAIELVGGGGLGAHGHIAIGTSDVGKAKAYLQKKGYTFNAGSEKFKDGKLIVTYLDHDFAGFAVHLVQA
ncbi:MAG: hypothetical protein LBG74_06635 [Spirochaetaceae bacterium]|nr:hypothetical protein [Spirochaetaceae bacterium]